MPFSIIINPKGSDCPIATNVFHLGIVITFEIKLGSTNIVFDNIYSEDFFIDNWLNRAYSFVVGLRFPLTKPTTDN